MSKILVIGGLGFIGQNLTKNLVKEGYEVIVYDYKLTTEELKIGSITYRQGSLSQTGKIFSLLDEYSIDSVIHLCSTLKPSSSFEDYLNEYNTIILPTFKLLTYLAAEKIKIIYFSSGGTIYGAAYDAPISESSPRHPINYYGQSKLVLEDAILLESRVSDLEYIILRPSNPYGPGQDLFALQGLVAATIGNILRKTPIQVWGDGNIIRDYFYIDDLTGAVCSLISKDIKNEIFNIGSGTGYTINQVLNKLMTIMKVDFEIKYIPQRNIDSDYMVLNVNKLEALIPYTPIPLDNGMKLFYQHLKSEGIFISG
jgi:UDP-glucose 4-epimerase